MAKVTDHAFDDLLTTQDTTWATAERRVDKAEEKNHRNASEYNASKNYGKKKTTKEMNDACGSSKKKKKMKK